MSAMSTELLGVAAASLVLITFSVRSLLALRCFAIASNLLFVGYGIAGQLLPILVLHALLLPLNAYRLRQLWRTTKIATPAASSEPPGSGRRRIAETCASARRPDAASGRRRTALRRPPFQRAERRAASRGRRASVHVKP